MHVQYIYLSYLSKFSTLYHSICGKENKITAVLHAISNHACICLYIHFTLKSNKDYRQAQWLSYGQGEGRMNTCMSPTLLQGMRANRGWLTGDVLGPTWV